MAKARITGIILFFILVIFSLGLGEDVSITTYYLSPNGAFKQLTTVSNTYLAISSGNVGIGTSSPQAKLDVMGDIQISQNGEIVNLRAENRSEPLPTPADAGRIVFNTTKSKLYYYNGSAWNSL